VTPDPADYADLDPDPYEMLMLEEALAEADAEEAAGYGDPGDGDPDPDPDGGDGTWQAAMERAGAALDDSAARDAQRLAEDVGDAIGGRPPRDEVRAARALRRIESGTYTQPEQLRPARDAGGLFAVSCGEALDEFGRCASRFHDPSCHTVAEAAAANGSHAEAEAWAAQLRGQPMDPDVTAAQQQLGLANEPVRQADPLGVDFGDLLDDGSRVPYDQLKARLLHEMALADAPPRQRQPDSPDTAAIRAALGI
jgi:hypothetical protein